MASTLAELAAALGLQRTGDDAPIRGVNTLEHAGPDEVSFLANDKYLKQLDQTRAAAVILRSEHAQRVPCALVSENPYLDFARALELFSTPQGCFSGVSEQAWIAEDAVLEEGCTVYPFAFIGSGAHVSRGSVLYPGSYVGENCRLGQECVLYPNAVLMAGCELGDRVIAHPGAVLGSDGFGFAPGPQGLRKIPQTGVVRVGNDVEIGANSTVDRAVMEATRIGSGSKIDNLVQIGHNVQLGSHCILVSQVGISGSTKVGDGVTMAGQVGVAGHLNIGDGATIGPKSGVQRNIPAGESWGGIPVMERKTFFRTIATIPKLPEIRKRVHALEKELAELRQRLQGKEDA